MFNTFEVFGENKVFVFRYKNKKNVFSQKNFKSVKHSHVLGVKASNLIMFYTLEVFLENKVVFFCFFLLASFLPATPGHQQKTPQSHSPAPLPSPTPQPHSPAALSSPTPQDMGVWKKVFPTIQAQYPSRGGGEGLYLQGVFRVGEVPLL